MFNSSNHDIKYGTSLANASNYLMERINNLYIEILEKYKGNLFELMYDGRLEGWCWQTTESAIIFLNDNDYIERGYIDLNENQNEYYHSWICFNFENEEYVFDPCLRYILTKIEYYRVLNAKAIGKVTAKDVRDELTRKLTEPKNENMGFEKFLKSIYGANYDEEKKKRRNEVIVSGTEDVNTPLYRNGAGYSARFEDKKIKQLNVHYYYTDV